MLLMQRQQVGQSLDEVVEHNNRSLESPAQGRKFYTLSSGCWKSLLLAGCLHQSWLSLSEAVQEVSLPSQRCHQFDCLLSDQDAGGEPTRRTNIRGINKSKDIRPQGALFSIESCKYRVCLQ